MVNYGVSRGCETCKLRRKKCDETRPTCKQCTKLNILCLGYREDSGYVFRNATSASTEDLSRQSIEQARPPILAAEIPALSDGQIETRVVGSFFENYTVPSANRNVSQGFLDGLERLIHFAGEDSDVAQAMKIVAIGGAANTFGRPELLNRSRVMYGALLGSFQKTLLDPVKGNTLESLMTTALLGIYEIIADTDAQAQHAAHVTGVAALLNIDDSPFKCNATGYRFQFQNSLHVKGMLSDAGRSAALYTPDSNPAVLELDSIFDKFAPAYYKAGLLFGSPSMGSYEAIFALMKDLMVVDNMCCKWAADRIGHWEPVTIGSITEDQAKRHQFDNCWPGSVDTYFDLYISSIWNTCRKTHLMALDLMSKCAGYIGSANIQLKAQQDAQRIAEEIAASVPFHLTSDAWQHLRHIQSGAGPASSGRPVGGLLMLHPLHTAARCVSVSQNLRVYMHERLQWIGREMGIGQAGLLGDPSVDLPWDYVAEGHLLLWAGMLIRPA